MKIKKLLIALLLTSSSMLTAQSSLFTVSPFTDQLYVTDTATMVQVSAQAITAPGYTISGCNGLAIQPCTGDVYVIFKDAAVTGRLLGVLDTITAVITPIGNTGDNVAGICFGAQNILYAVTGDGASTASTLHTVDLATATMTPFVTLGNGSDGESIAFNSDDGNIYHWSGLGTTVMESIDTLTGNVTNIPMSGYGMSEVFGSMYMGNNMFMIANISAEYILMDVSGFAVNTGIVSIDNLKGLVISSPPIPAPMLSTMDTTAFCPGDSAVFNVTAGTGYQWYLDGGAIAGATNQMYTIMQGGLLSCEVTVAGGCVSSSDTVLIDLLNVPNVGLIPAIDTTYCVGDSVLLTGSSGGSSQWYMNGNMIAGATSNMYYASMPGIYNMTKTNANGCSDSSAVGVLVIEDSCLGVYNLENISSLNVYPSPVTNELTVDFEKLNVGNVAIVIHSITGELVWNEEEEFAAGNTHFKLDLKDLSNGVYILELRTGSVSVKRKFIKQ